MPFPPFQKMFAGQHLKMMVSHLIVGDHKRLGDKTTAPDSTPQPKPIVVHAVWCLVQKIFLFPTVHNIFLFFGQSFEMPDMQNQQDVFTILWVWAICKSTNDTVNLLKTQPFFGWTTTKKTDIGTVNDNFNTFGVKALHPFFKSIEMVLKRACWVGSQDLINLQQYIVVLRGC